MKYKVFENIIAVRLNRGDEILQTLQEICTAEHVTAGIVTGIGAVDSAVVGLYEVENRSYVPTSLTGEMEVTNLTGNISQKDGAVYLHLHATLAAKGGSAMGGHLNEGHISGAGEIFIQKLAGAIQRIPDPETGLNIMDWDD